MKHSGNTEVCILVMHTSNPPKEVCIYSVLGLPVKLRQSFTLCYDVTALLMRTSKDAASKLRLVFGNGLARKSISSVSVFVLLLLLIVILCGEIFANRMQKRSGNGLVL